MRGRLELHTEKRLQRCNFFEEWPDGLWILDLIASGSEREHRAFIKMRETLLGTRELAEKLEALEKQLKGRLDTHEVAIVGVPADNENPEPASAGKTAHRFHPLSGLPAIVPSIWQAALRGSPELW